jgi:hypothetical protein
MIRAEATPQQPVDFRPFKNPFADGLVFDVATTPSLRQVSNYRGA